MTIEPEKDPVEESLRSLPYVDDAGFTDRVMARLPAPRARRRWPLAASVAAAAGIAAATLPTLVGEALEASAAVSALPAPAVLATGAVLVLCAAGAVARILWE